LSNIHYLSDIPLREALDRWKASIEAADLWRILGEQEVPIDLALGRVTARPVWAKTSSPHYAAAAMDGFALHSSLVENASDRKPVIVEVGTDAIYVDTGEPIPDWADHVIPIEEIQIDGPGEDIRSVDRIIIRHSSPPWKHVRPIGEDTMATELVVPSGSTLRPVDLGAIAGTGHSSVFVARKPAIAILPTGTELVSPGTNPEPGQIIEFNSLVLAALIETWGGEAIRWASLPDDLKLIRNAVQQAAETADLVLVIAGSSAGSEDLTAPVVESLGQILVHGVAIRPGHPVLLGILTNKAKRTPIIGVPGFPVSAILTAELFIQPLLDQWLGRNADAPEMMQAVMSKKIHSSLGDDEYLRVSLGKVGKRVIAAPLSRGAGVISSLVRADGMVVIPAGFQGIPAGEQVTVRLLRSRQEIMSTLMMHGSHDITIDILAQFLAVRGIRLASASVGSLGGLIALSRDEAHLAGSHLLDPPTGEFNLAYVRKYLPNRSVFIIGLVGRKQGFLVKRGNPKAILEIADLTRENVQFVNRQRGSGTRYLLDYHLQQKSIEPNQIYGYAQEEYDHLSLAAKIASGRADCGLGIQAAADAMNLDFVHLFDERYDLVIPEEYYFSGKMEVLLELLTDPSFREAIGALPGYDLLPMGTLVQAP
jgi:putative molybdopterin biosynthesis protein